MTKRYSFAYKGDKYLGNSVEAIAFRIIKSYPELSLDQATEIIITGLRQNVPAVASNKFITGEKAREKGKEFKDYVNGAHALIKVISGNAVDQEEINRRSIICTSCPQLEVIPGCMGCGLAKKITNFVNDIKQLFGKGFTIPNGLEKQGCGVCKCALSVMIPCKIDQFKETDQDERPNNCWVKKTSKNYIA